jgi:uncharacterized membrane protein YsdA (DUF1294 family)
MFLNLIIGFILPAYLLAAYDKWAAIKGWRRIPEWFLLGLALLGGWPGIFLAMLPPIHHKSSKKSFLNLFIAFTLSNIGLNIGFIYLFAL